MAESINRGEQRAHARATGVIYLCYFVAAILGLYLGARKLPAGTMLNGFAPVLYATVTILLWRLFSPSQPFLALLAACSSLAGCFNDELRHLHSGFANLNSLVFFGPFCILLGLLIVRSQFLPSWLGWPLILAGLCWLAYLVPVIAARGKAPIFALGFLAEFEFMVWLLCRGVDETRWRESRH